MSIYKTMKQLIRLFLLFFTSLAFCTSAQTTDTVVMVSPDTFGFNTETAETNVFEKKIEQNSKAQKDAMKEFRNALTALQNHQVKVIVLPSRKDIITPDAVFPNNWFLIDKASERKLILFPMFAKDRRSERQPNLLIKTLEREGIEIDKTIDLTSYETKQLALEGTGSLVLDHINKVAYASLSPRTNVEVLNDFCQKLNYRPVVFKSYDANKLIYHTNVMMSVGTQFAIVCLESIKDPKEREVLQKELNNSGRQILVISIDQVNHMCGNVLELKSTEGNPLILMSKEAFSHFSKKQRQELKKFGDFIIVKIPTIEQIGGGSARCMVAEVF